MPNSYHDDKGVFKNKYGIEDGGVLNVLEYEISARRIYEIIDGSRKLKNHHFDIEHLKEIHEHIFGDVYEWAGKIRTVPSSKRAPNGLVSVFSDVDLIGDKWALLANKTKAFTDNKNSTLSEKVDALADIFAEANHIHPFPEGNGRSLQVFMTQLARTQNIALDYSKVDSIEWNNASSLSGVHGRLFERVDLIQHPTDKKPINEIFHKMARLIDAE